MRQRDPEYYRKKRERYATDTQYRKTVAMQGRERRLRHKVTVEAIKTHYGCLNPDCQWTAGYHPASLDFHHIDPTVKEHGLSKINRYAFNEKTRDEINKCTVLCANCHRALHAGQVMKPLPLCKVDDQGKPICIPSI